MPKKGGFIMMISENLIYEKHSISKNGFSCGIGTVVEESAYTNRTQNNDFVISWVLKGSGKFTEGGQVYTLHDECVCMRRPDRDYRLELVPNSGIRLYLTFPKEVYPTLVWLIPELETFPPVWALPYNDAYIEDFFTLYDRVAALSSLELYDAIPTMMHYILCITGIERNRAHNPLLRGRLLLEECNSLSVAEVADRCGMNRNTFRKKFTNAFGVSPVQYRIRHRIAIAKKFLVAGLPVGEIAISLGYPDIYSFTHQFTAVTGYSPTEFREIC